MLEKIKNSIFEGKYTRLVPFIGSMKNIFDCYEEKELYFQFGANHDIAYWNRRTDNVISLIQSVSNGEILGYIRWELDNINSHTLIIHAGSWGHSKLNKGKYLESWFLTLHICISFLKAKKIFTQIHIENHLAQNIILNSCFIVLGKSNNKYNYVLDTKSFVQNKYFLYYSKNWNLDSIIKETDEKISNLKIDKINKYDFHFEKNIDSIEISELSNSVIEDNFEVIKNQIMSDSSLQNHIIFRKSYYKHITLETLTNYFNLINDDYRIFQVILANKPVMLFFQKNIYLNQPIFSVIDIPIQINPNDLRYYKIFEKVLDVLCSKSCIEVTIFNKDYRRFNLLMHTNFNIIGFSDILGIQKSDIKFRKKDI